MKRFEVGTEYGTRSIGNHDCIFAYKVVARSAKTVTILDGFGLRKRCRLKEDGDAEFIFPEGRYSMCPVLRANRTLAAAKADC